MSTDDLPGFIEDEAKPTSKPAAAPAKHFNAFADVPAPAAPLAAPPAKPPTAPAAAAPAKAKDFNAFADAAATPDTVDEAGIKPGAAKDLWACPHCGAKSKPERTTCRACGKSPSDPVIVLWHENPVVKPAIAAGVVLVVVLLGWLLGGGVRMVVAEAASIDSAPRTGSKGIGAPSEFDGHTFTPRKRYAVCGRVVGSQSNGGLMTLVLALGADGKDEEKVNAAGIDFSGSEPVTMPEMRSATLTCFGELPSLGKGQIVSLIGDCGSLDGTDGPVVRVEKIDAF